MARLVSCLVALRSEFDGLFPLRDKASDGWIADAAHSSTSDHQPDGRGLVHAIDVDADLRGTDMARVVAFLVARCRSGREKRLTYIIYNRRIWSASGDWNGRVYTGRNPHDKHVHISASATPAREQDTRPWHLEEIPVALTDDDKKWIAATVAEAVWEHKLRNPYSDKDQPAGTILRYVPSRSPHEATQAAVTDLGAKLAEIERKVDALGKPTTTPARAARKPA